MKKTKKGTKMKVSRGQSERKVCCGKWCDGGAGGQGNGKPARCAIAQNRTE